jgi:hypothetical protein
VFAFSRKIEFFNEIAECQKSVGVHSDAVHPGIVKRQLKDGRSCGDVTVEF